MDDGSGLKFDQLDEIGGCKMRNHFIILIIDWLTGSTGLLIPMQIVNKQMHNQWIEWNLFCAFWLQRIPHWSSIDISAANRIQFGFNKKRRKKWMMMMKEMKEEEKVYYFFVLFCFSFLEDVCSWRDRFSKRERRSADSSPFELLCHCWPFQSICNIWRCCLKTADVMDWWHGGSLVLVGHQVDAFF